MSGFQRSTDARSVSASFSLPQQRLFAPLAPRPAWPARPTSIFPIAMIWTPRIGRRRRAIDILQLFFAETKRLKPLRRNLEGVHQNIADRIRRAAGSGSDCGRAGRRTRHDRRSGSDRAAISDRSARRRGCRSSDRRPAGSGRNPGRTRRRNGFAAASELRRDRRPLLRLGIRPRLDPIGRLLPQGSQIDVRLRLDRKLLDDIARRWRRLRVRPRPSARHKQRTGRPAPGAMSRSFFPRRISDTPRR